ncbi:MAG: trypsin-like peptidase domain-containing protein [Chloroflexi bacterium]|nr:trypsin-like peptidase domain-containing protein [Chloroflexota bacterium]
MKQLRHHFIAPMTIGAIIALLMLAALPAAGIYAVDLVSHPNDVFTDAYRNASPSVVAISVEREEGGGNGSGFVIDKDGHILTNAHVVDEAREIVVNFIDGAKVRGTTIGIDRASDLAVVKVDLPAEQLSPIPFADSQDLVIGQIVLAIGSPFGQGWTLTSGIVSALDRRIRGLTEFSIGGVIQTDASINPGNSGGPLINLDGEVIGVNSQIISETRSSAGVGFAIPSNLARRVARSLIETGEMRYSLIGITGFDVPLNVSELLGLPNNFRGVVVREVVDGGPAAASDLREIAEMRTLDNELVDMRVDIITAIDGVAINGMNDLITYLARKTHPHQEITLSVLRDGLQELELPLRLGSR